MTEELTKVCPKCGRELSLSEFTKDKTRVDGLNLRCKSCTREYSKVWKETHHSDAIAYKRKYWKCVTKPSCPRVGKNGAQFESFTCEVCGAEFRRLKSDVDYNYERRGYLPRFCSKECQIESMRKSHTSKYAKEIERIKKEV